MFREVGLIGTQYIVLDSAYKSGFDLHFYLDKSVFDLHLYQDKSVSMIVSFKVVNNYQQFAINLCVCVAQSLLCTLGLMKSLMVN